MSLTSLASLDRPGVRALGLDGLDGFDANRDERDVQADVLHAFRLLETQSAQRPQRQTATEQTELRGKLSTLFPRWLIIVNLCSLICCVVVEGLLHPRWPHKDLERPLQYPVRVAYGTLLALVFSLTHLLNGVRSSFVFAGLLMVLALVGLVDHMDIVTGFARVGPWLPQLQFVIICGIRDSGILEFSLLWMLGRNPKQGHLPRSRLYCAVLLLGAFVGATTAITTATPVIIQWAKSHSFKLRPLLLLMVVAATCGNSVFVTSSPSSIAIRDILCVTNCELKSQAFLALANAAFLGLYVVIIGEFLAKKDHGPSVRETQQTHRLADEGESEEKPNNSDQLHYELDFVVLMGSFVCGHTVHSAGFMNLPGVAIQRLSRLQKSRRSNGSVNSSNDVRTTLTAEGSDLDDWVLEAEDLITARCSTAGVCAMRRYPGVFVMRGLHCHQALGGRRHERRLYESVVAGGSEVVGRSLEELLGFPTASDSIPPPETLAVPWCVRVFRGYPLAAWRREVDGVRPLSPHLDVLAEDDVVLIDAFGEFPSLHTAQRHFLISGLVPKSQAPRHGRATDMWRGIMAATGLIVALVLDLQKRCNILVSTMVIVAMLCVSSGVKPNQISEVMDWNSCLTIGLGEGVAVALRRSGLQAALAKLIIHIRDVGGLPLQLCVLSFTAQLAAACISPTPAGLLVANSALALDNEYGQLSSRQLVLLIVISCNMVLTVPMPDELMRRRKRAFSVRSMFMWSLPTAVLVAGLTAAWTLLLAHVEDQ